MYRDFFGLEEEPFNNTPDVKYLYLSSQHREALAHMLYGIKEKKGFITITGEIGAGKTTICRALLNELDPKTKVAIIFNSFISELELLKTINQELFLEYSSNSKKDLIDQLNRFLLEQHSMGGNVVLIIDEAQNLSIQVLEQIRMLSNLETENEKLLQIILVGQPELQDILEEEKLKQLKQRVSVHYHLNPLPLEETREYILHRLKVAGLKGSLVFSEEAFELIFSYSRGVPRMINNICDRILLTAYTSDTKEIKSEIAQEALNELTFEKKKGKGEKKPRGVIPQYARAVVLGLILGVFIVSVWWLYSQIEVVTVTPDSFKRDTPSMEEEKPLPAAPTSEEEVAPDFEDVLKRLTEIPPPSVPEESFLTQLDEAAYPLEDKSLAGLFYVFEREWIDFEEGTALNAITDQHFNVTQKEGIIDLLENLNIPYIAFIEYDEENPELPTLILSHEDQHINMYNPLYNIIEDVPYTLYENIRSAKALTIYPNYIDLSTMTLSSNSREIYQLKRILASLDLYDGALNTFVDEELNQSLGKISDFFDISFEIPMPEETRQNLNVIINFLVYHSLYENGEREEYEHDI